MAPLSPPSPYPPVSSQRKELATVESYARPAWCCQGAGIALGHLLPVRSWAPHPTPLEVMIPDSQQAVLAGKGPLGTRSSRESHRVAHLVMGQLEKAGSTRLPPGNHSHIPCHQLIGPTFLTVMSRSYDWYPPSGPLPPPTPSPTADAPSGTSSLLLQGFWSGIRNNEASKFTGLVGTAFGETHQMGPNCRPVVGTLLTNTQVAEHGAFWNRMRLGSWGRRSNYRHLSFLFNEGGCGARPCWRQPV